MRWGEDFANKCTCHPGWFFHQVKQDDNLSLTPGTQRVGEESQLLKMSVLLLSHHVTACMPHPHIVNQPSNQSTVNVIKATIGICQKLLRTKKNFSSASGSLILSPVTCHQPPQSHPQGLAITAWAYWKTLRSVSARKQDGVRSQCSITGWVEH